MEVDLVAHIKKKKELSALDDEYVKDVLSDVLKDNPLNLEKYSSFSQAFRSKKVKNVVAETRRRLRSVYGLFVRKPLTDFSVNKINSYDDEIIDKILDAHQSTFERATYYSSLYPLIFDRLFVLGLKKSFVLLDLACGNNPFAYKFFPVKPVEYIALDLSSKDMFFVEKFFLKTGIKGQSVASNLLSEKTVSWLVSQKADLCFLFKALDPLESVRRHSSKKLLLSMNIPFFVVSFSLVSVGGNNQISSSKRVWFERFCEKNGWFYETLQIPNELFYIIKTT